ncbi:MAG: HTH domain-containing protein [Spirochaetia bacterium]|nr:HTH domain-containing protein [Spirochaetia bacterium]
MTPAHAFRDSEADRAIIQTLRRSEGPVSGPDLADRLGISRVALWKRVQSLAAKGYGISSARDGYRLYRDDGLSPGDLDIPGLVYIHSELGSTMDEARTHARAGAPNGSVVLAMRQNSGRSHSGEPWHSPDGGLYLTAIVRPRLPAGHAGAVLLESAVAALESLNGPHAEPVSFRWPNAIVDKRTGAQFGGLLVETDGSTAMPAYFLVGLGVRVAVTGSIPRRTALASHFTRALALWAERPTLKPDRWHSLLPEGSSLSARLWNGAEQRITKPSWNARGDLVDASGVTIGHSECATVSEPGTPHIARKAAPRTSGSTRSISEETR